MTPVYVHSHELWIMFMYFNIFQMTICLRQALIDFNCCLASQLRWEQLQPLINRHSNSSIEQAN